MSVTFDRFEDLEAWLRNWVNWRGGELPYDFGGMATLLEACIDNLRNHALVAELEDLAASLTPEQVAFLRRLCAGSAGGGDQ